MRRERYTLHTAHFNRTEPVCHDASQSSPPENTDDVRDSASAHRATAAIDSRAEVKLDPCAQLFEAGS